MKAAGKLLVLLMLGMAACGPAPSLPETQGPPSTDVADTPSTEPEVTQTFQKPGAPLIPQQEVKPSNSVDHGEPVADPKAVAVPPTPPQPTIPESPKPAVQPTPHPTPATPSTTLASTPVSSQPAPAAPAKINSGPQCQASYVLNLSTSELVDYLKTHTYSCIRFLWTYDFRSAAVYSDENMNAVLGALGDVGQAFDGSNRQNAFELFTFVRVAYYHKFYNYNNVPFQWNNVRSQTIKALRVFEGSAALRNFSTAGGILVEWIQTIDGASLGEEFLPTLKNYLKIFYAEKSRWNSTYERNAAYSVLYLFSRRYGKMTDPEMLDLLTDYALDPELALRHAFFANNAIWGLGKVYHGLAPWKTAALEALTQIYNAHEDLSEAQLWTVKVLTQSQNCATLSDQRQVCRSDTVKRLETKLFPNEFHFDDGALVIRTPLPYADLLPLYQASKQVAAQFKRVTFVTDPLPNDPNARLTILLYGSRQEYQKYQSFLYNLPTNNGGIYIEQKGTFYTHQRTPSESIYTLEELFRHEYVHYLVGRYLVVGMWGRSPIYGGSRMQWFDEGLAEFLAGSTPSQGVAPRKRLAGLIAGSQQRMTPERIFASRYSDGFEFYHFAGTFFNYLYEQNMERLRRLLEEVHDSDVSGFDAWIADGRKDSQLQTAYFSYLDDLILSLPVLKNPSTAVADWSGMNEENLGAVAGAFASVAGHSEADCRLSASLSAKRFLCIGKLNGNSAGKNLSGEEAWRQSDQELNQMMETLAGAAALNHFKDMTCWMNGASGFYCEGPLGLSAALKVEPVAQPVAVPTPTPTPTPVALSELQKDFRSTRLGKFTVCLKVANRMECASPVSSPLRSKETSADSLLAAFQKSVAELQSSVKNLRPQDYAGLICEMNAALWKVIPWFDGRVYSAGAVRCQISN